MGALNILVTESEPGTATPAAEVLEAAGHTVARCRDVGAGFPCRGLAEGDCPLDHAPVDVVLTVRGHPDPEPEAGEDGVACALRRHVPLVVAGRTTRHPYGRWATVVLDGTDGVAAACEAAAGTPLGAHAHLAAEAARRVVEVHGLDAQGVSARAHRRHGSLLVEVVVPGSALAHEAVVASRVLGAVRAHDRDALAIDVSVHAVDV